MLSDSLFDAYEALKSDYLRYHDAGFYSKNVHDEVENILERMDALRIKLDMAQYRGTYHFEDGGALQRHKIAILNYQQEVLTLAGDLSQEEETDEVFFTSHQKNMCLAHDKLVRQGKQYLLDMLHEKYFNKKSL